VYSDSSEPQPESPAISPAARRIVINQESFKSSFHLYIGYVKSSSL